MDELLRTTDDSWSNDIESYIQKSDWQIKENANSDISYSGLQAYMTKKNIKRYSLSQYPDMIRKAYLDGYFHIHNLSDGIVPYSYIGSTSILVRDANIKRPFFTSLKDVQGKSNLETLQDNATWVNIIDTQSHPSHCDLIGIETDNGRILIVTEDHPIFVGLAETTVPASELNVGDKLTTALPSRRFVFGRTHIASDIAWLLGMYIAKGFKRGKNYCIEYDSPEKNKILRVLVDYNIDFSIYGKDIVINGDNLLVKRLFSVPENGSHNKAIPYTDFTQETFFDIIAGIIDGDGWCITPKQGASIIGIDTTSYELVSQLKTLFDIIRLPVAMRFSTTENIFKLKIFMEERCITLFSESLKITSKNDIRYRVGKPGNIDYYDRTPRVKKLWRIPWKGKMVYDITTESGIFSTVGLKVHNCYGADLFKLLNMGLITTRIRSKPAKHLNTAVDHIVNFMATSQQEWAGAQAISNVNWLLAPFVYHDNLSYEEVKQEMQRLIFNLNYPSRAGYQCVSEDTLTLTLDGWKSIDEISESDLALTFNMETREIEVLPIHKVVRYNYNGLMYHIHNERTDQLVVPEHRVITFPYYDDTPRFEMAKDIFDRKSRVLVPAMGLIDREDYPITDEEIRLWAWIVSEGNITPNKTKEDRIVIGQSILNPENIECIRSTLSDNGIEWTESEYSGGCANAPVKRFTFYKSGYSKSIPKWTSLLSRNQARLFLSEYRLGDGSKSRFRLYTNSESDLLRFQELCVIAGYLTNNRLRDNGVYDISIVRDFTDRTYAEVETIPYDGRVYGINTDNNSMIVLRNGKIAFTGNTPFTNLIFDSKCPKQLRELPVLDNGNTYEDFADEAETIIKAFNHVLYEGDGIGSVFTFPIPTLNLIKSTDFSSDLFYEIMRTDAKFGNWYYMNYVGSGIDEDSVQAMCFQGETKVIYRVDGRVSRDTLRNLYRTSTKHNIEALVNGEFVPCYVDAYQYDSNLLYVYLDNGNILKVTKSHLFLTDDGVIRAVDLRPGVRLPMASTPYDTEYGTYDLGRLIGLYIAEGLDTGKAIQFTFHSDEAEHIDFITKFLQRTLGARSIKVPDPRSSAVSLLTYDKSVRGLVRSFVSGRLSTEKKLRAAVFRGSVDFRQGLIDGLWQGDGYNRDNELHINNPELADDICDVLGSLGIKYTRTLKTSQVIRICKDNSSKYTDQGGYQWVSVIDIKEKYHADTVYTLELPEPHLYQLANGVITHNCCRLNLDLSQLPPAGGRWALSGNTGSIGVITLNLGRLGYISREESELFDNLDMTLSMAREALEIKGDIVNKSINSGLMPIARIYEVDLSRFFRTIGIVGLNEMCINHTGSNIIEAGDLAIRVLQYIRNWTKTTQQETGLLWNFEMTPAEGSATDLAIKDRKKYPDIYTMGETDSPYYTSMITPPSYEMGMEERLLFEEPYLTTFTGGTVHRIYVGEADPHPAGLAKLTESIAKNTKVPYFDFSATFSICPKCGSYQRGVHYDCSSCGGATEVFSRVVGYYRSTNKYNKGKLQEFNDRTYINVA